MPAKRFRPGFTLVFWREFGWLRRRPFLVLLATFIPICAFLILAMVYARGIATNLPIAVLDLDGTTSSNRIIQLVDSTPAVSVVAHVAGLEEGRKGIVRGDYYGLLFIPENFTRDVAAGRRPELNYFYNTQMLSAGNLTASAVSAALPAISAAVQSSSRMARGITAKQASVAIQPIPLQIHGLFNPELDYSHFVLAALAVAVLQLSITLSACYSIGLDAETSHRLRILRRLGGGSILPALFAKLLPLTLVAMFTLAICDLAMFWYFGLPLNGSGWIYAASALVFILSCQFLGAIFALAIQPTAGALSVAGILISPSFGYLGISFPREAMNVFPQHWGAVFPGTLFAQIRIDETVRATPTDVTVNTLVYQLVYLLVVMLIAYVLLIFTKRRADTRRAALEAAL